MTHTLLMHLQLAWLYSEAFLQYWNTKYSSYHLQYSMIICNMYVIGFTENKHLWSKLASEIIIWEGLILRSVTMNDIHVIMYK